ncbi:MAG: hypothetical protein ACHREM_23770 [Polyangiales bacterium]
MTTIHVGEEFEIKRGRRVDRFRREADEPSHDGPFRITHVSCSDGGPSWFPYTFSQSEEWFTERGLCAHTEAVLTAVGE